ncbi:O-succinylbenzoate-CoA ligase [Veillonella parvula DSM 2008]|uniref:o-succinylbenzoate--CoA ligase n=1 Tax=Veillonella parvula TaxID=29466 RepID=UPI00019C0252|nr:o-succinylbenzoate--CoA ligase [Veillonella parvula]ACZ24061.1 O-succinylbenzoate-CoA ligase [Veillonella parvula DSM 2008]QQB16664.1 o-succinylbenzoate--CoA ligase [Veillonella parvula]SNU94968.1 2-succinylbenzoate--CoA ligase [Veillonella parvula]
MEWLRYGAQHYPNRKCINEYTYNDIYRGVLHVARNLVPLDAPRVAILSDNSVTMAMYVLAAMLVHKEVLLLNVHLKPKEIENQLDQLGVTTVLHSKERRNQLPDTIETQVLNLVEPIASDSIENQLSHFVDSKAASNPIVTIEFETLERILSDLAVEDSFDWVFVDTDIAAIMNTSATTGQFKSVPLRWGQIKAHVQASQEVLGKTEQDNWLMVLPLFHVSGLSILMRSLYNGTAVTILPKYDEAQVLKLIESEQINMMSLVPTILTQLESRITHHNLRVILLGGEFIPMALIEACEKKSLPIYKTYGMTETFSQSVTFSILEYPHKRESVGKPLPGMQVRIDNPDADGVGEIHLTGPMVMSGYINKESIDGDFNTDDIGYIDEDGFIYILNRRKDLIISGGENVYPKELEDLVYTLPSVKECAVVPVPDAKWGQVPALFVAFHDGKSLLPEDILAFMSNSLAKYKVPKYVKALTALPRNGTGKILRNELKLEN